MKLQPQLERLHLRLRAPQAQLPRPSRAVRVVEAVVMASLLAYFFLGAYSVLVP